MENSETKEEDIAVAASPSLSLKSDLSTTSSLVKRKSMELQEFKTPAPMKKKRKVLEEDKFVEELEQIIQRDFFPELEKLKAQNAYLHAVENNDIHMLRELYSKYSLGRTPRPGKSAQSTPSVFETPIELQGQTKSTPTPSTSDGLAATPTPTHLPMESPVRGQKSDLDSNAATTKKLKNYSLNTFLDNFTSEDNKSFQDIVEDSERKHRIKYNWLYDKEEEHDQKQKLSLALPSCEKQCEYEKPFEVETWSYKNKNYIMYPPDGASLTPAEQVQLAKRTTQVQYENTRFLQNPFKEKVEESAKSSAVKTTRAPSLKIGIDGKEVTSDNPTVQGFSFVRTPSPTPGVEESPYLTWGEIEGTPFRLDAGDTPLPTTNVKPYRMLEQTKRERIAIELTEKVSERYRDKKLKAIEVAKSNLKTPTPSSSRMDRFTNLSSAAKNLAKSRISSGLMSGDKSLRASYTPTRESSVRSTLSTPHLFPSAKTPSASTPSAKNPSGGFTTDNLLQLPPTKKNAKGSRASASEFF